MIVPELPADIAELKRQIGDFIKAEVYPVELKIAERNAIDTAEVDALRAKARAAGFSMLNMPARAGRPRSLDARAGRARGGVGQGDERPRVPVVDRGPRELLELLTPEQVEKYVMPIVRGEYREAWALTEPGAGSDLAALAATADRDGDEWVINGEKWFVTSEGDAGIYLVAAVHEGEQLLFLVEPGTPGMEITKTPRFLHDPYLDHHPEIVFTNCRVPAANQVSGGDSGSREWILVERLFIAARCCGAALRLLDEATAWAQEREAFGGPIFENQGVSFPLADSLTELHAARLLTYHAAHAFDTLEDRKVVHGKVAMAKLYASEMAGRVADRAVQIHGGRGYMHDNAAARFFREVRVDRIWEGTSEIQKLIIARGLQKRGAAPYLGWE